MEQHLARAACLLASAVPCGAFAQAFPARPIEFVVPGNPGAGSGVFARLIADIARKEKSKMHAGLKRNFQVMPGAQWLGLLCKHIPDRYEHLVRYVLRKPPEVNPRGPT